MPGWAVASPLAPGEAEADFAPDTIAAPVPFFDSVRAAWDDATQVQALGARADALNAAIRQRNLDVVDRVGPEGARAVLGRPGLDQAAAEVEDYRAGDAPALAGDPARVDEAAIEALRQKHPTAMAGVMTAEQVKAQVDARLNALAARAGIASAQHPIGAFLGGATAQLTDPVNLELGLATGGAAEGAPIAVRMLAQSGIWAGLAAVEAPLKAAEAHSVGGPAYGVPEALSDIGGAALAGPVFEGAHAVLSPLLKAAARPLLDRFAQVLRTPEADAERGAVDVLNTAALDARAVGPARDGGDYQAGLASLATGAPAPSIEPARDMGDLFGPPPAPGADLATTPTFADAPPGAALYQRAEYRGRAIYAGSFDPAGLNTDAAGVTDTLKGVQAWDPTSSGKVIVYQAENGRQFVADGHQRLALAKRMSAAGFEPRLDGYLFRASDGWSPMDVRVIAALKNIREGQGNPLDAAKVFRDAPGAINDDSLPVSGDFIRQAKGLARLSPDAFGAVVNKVIPERYGALIGQLAGDRPDLHEGLVRLLRAGDPQNVDEAHVLIQEALQDEWVKGQGAQGDLFGDSPAQSIAIGRAKLRAWLLKNLRADGRLFSQLTRHADAIEAAGNTLSRDANEANLAVTNVALEAIAKLGMRAGEMGDAMNAAAREISGGARVADAGKGILARVMAAIRAGERIDEGRAGLLNPDAPTAPAEAAAAAFDEPGGKGQAAQIPPKPEDAGLEGAAAAPSGLPDAAGGLRGDSEVSTLAEWMAAQPQDLAEIYARAPAAQEELGALGSEIAYATGATFKNPGMKKAATAAEKLTRKGYASAGKMTDIVRGGFLVDSPAQADAVVAALAARHDVIDEGWNVTVAGYMDRKVLVRTPEGLVAEVQIWGRAMYEAKDSRGQALYTEARSLSPDSPRARALLAEQRALYAAAQGEAFAELGGASEPNRGSNLDRQAASDSSAPVSWTSQKSTGVQSAPGESLATAEAGNSTAGRSSQLTNFIDRPPSGSDYTIPVSEAPPAEAPDHHPDLFADLPADDAHAAAEVHLKSCAPS